jgi:hypothetical protein
MLDNLVVVACAPSAQGRRDMLAKNCLEGLLSLADAHNDWPKLSGKQNSLVFLLNVVNKHFLLYANTRQQSLLANARHHHTHAHTHHTNTQTRKWRQCTSRPKLLWNGAGPYLIPTSTGS